MRLFAFLFDLFGRARRRDFWLFMTALVAIYSLILNALRSPARSYDGIAGEMSAIDMLVHNDVAFIGLALMQIATLAMIVRRLHDRNKSGMWAVFVLVPVLGQLWMVWELGLMPGTPGNNRYGPPPRAQITTL
ncbi:MAG: DUF805 domain-containing protein [Asticcacaulis sp.]